VIAIDIRCLDIIECKVAALLIAKFGHPPEEIFIMWSFSRLHTDKADAQHLVLLRPCRERPSRRCAAEKRDELAALPVWMAPAWQEIIWRAAQRSLAVMCPACWCSPGGLLALMGCANRVLIIQTGSMSR